MTDEDKYRRLERYQRYNRSEKGRLRHLRYEFTEKGRATRRKYQALGRKAEARRRLKEYYKARCYSGCWNLTRESILTRPEFTTVVYG